MDDYNQQPFRIPQKPPSFFEKLVDPAHSNSPYPTNLIIVLVVLIVIGLTLSIYPFIKTLSSTPKSAPAGQAQITPIPTADPIADWKTYSLKTLPISLKAPAILDSFGTLIESQEKVNSATRYCGGYLITLGLASKPAGCNFPDTSPLLFGTTSTDYPQATKFLELQGFIKLNGRYFARISPSKTQEIPANLISEVRNKNGVNIIRITGDDNAKIVTPGKGWVGALANIQTASFSGMALQVKTDYASKGGEIFDQILSTVKITE